MDTTAIRRAGTPLDRGVAIMREAAKNMAGEYMLPQRTEEGAPDLYEAAGAVIAQGWMAWLPPHNFNHPGVGLTDKGHWALHNVLGRVTA